jgi:hypothetical protein
MGAKYYIVMFVLCLFVWAILIDNLILPDKNRLKQDNGAYTRYRVKEWNKGRKLDVIQNELMIYAVVDNREQLYYMDYQTYFEAALKSMPEYMPIQLRYVYSLPKFWKRQLYDIRTEGRSIMTYSSYYMEEKQKENWKMTGIMGGIYAILVVLGLVSKRRVR